MEPLPLSTSSSRSSGTGFVGGVPPSASGVGGFTGIASGGGSSGGSDHKLSAKLESWSATLAGGGRGVMRAAAGGLTLRRGDSAVGTGPAKTLSIAVVGLSGSEKDKGSVGIGKSCLCNRFIQPLADNYSVDHISVFSQSDFSGRVVNNDHFLFWGDIRKYNEEGTEFHLQVVEQTEFIDDASFQPFRASGKSEPYVKRCSNTRLNSAEKLAYICKDQLGLEREYEQKLLPDGRFLVDGFLVLFDVSMVPNRSPERQVEITSQILMNVLKSKKPAVIVATKCDEANEILVRELERLVNRKEFKALNIPVVETSSHENINVDHAFFALAQLIDKSRGRSRIVSYMEAAHIRREVLDFTTEGYVRLLRQEVRDYGALWGTALKKLCQFQEYQNYVNEFGRESAQRLFRRHVKKLKDEYLGEKVQRYFDLLPEVLREMFPDFDTLGEGDWGLVKERVREHPDFHHFFIEHPNDTTWMEADLFDGDVAENRIPFEILEMPDAETVFKNHLNQLHVHHKILELRHDFKKMLEDMGCVTPGKSLNELRVLFLGRECFENLPEKEIVEIYDLHQRELIQKAKKNFQELLLERADLFYQFRSSPAGTVTQDDILDITESLQEDSRWKALDRLDADRKLLLFQHLGFVHCPIREHCPAFPHCTDSLVERIVAKKAQRPPSWSRTNDNNHLNLVILGVESLASNLALSVRTLCHDDEFEHQGQVFSLDYRTISGDVSLPENTFRTQDFLPHGCFCTFSDPNSFEYIRTSLEKTLLSNLEQEDRLPFQGLPLVIVFGPRANLTFKELETLREEGQALADSLQCPFIDVCLEGSLNPDDAKVLFKDVLIEESLRALIESIRHRSGLLNIYKSVPNNASEPDIRIIMCLLCGDPYSVENVLGPLLNQQNCYLSGERSLALETQLGDSKRKVEVILSSYHSVNDFQDELVHGFILVYSTKRKASLATLSAFSMKIPQSPIQILAVTEGASHPGGIGFSASSELDSLLINEGNNLADRLNAHFMTSTSAIQQKSSFYTPFFKEVFEKKSEIERAFSMDSSTRLDDSGEGTLERPRRQPMPPPRIDSYRMYSRPPGPPSNASRSGSGSEIYERLHDEDRLPLSGSEDSDVYNSMDRPNGSGRPIVPGAEHLVKPSQVKNRKKQPAALTALEIESLPLPPRPSFFKPTPSASVGVLDPMNSASLSPPTYARVSKEEKRLSAPQTRVPPPPYAIKHGTPPPLPTSQRPPLPSRSFAQGAELSGGTSGASPASNALPTFFPNKGDLLDDFPPGAGPSTPPEPAPMDPSNSFRDPRANPSRFRGSSGDRQPSSNGGNGNTNNNSGNNSNNSRLVKASTMPCTGSHTSLDDAGSSCWVDDSIFIRRSGHEDDFASNGSSVNAGAFTTGRRGRGPPPVKPRAQLPGKLNMNDFQKVTSALSTMQVDVPKRSPRTSTGSAPLASAEDVDQQGYAVPRDTLAGTPQGSGAVYAQPVTDVSNGRGHSRTSHRERREQIALQHDETDSESDSSSDEARSSGATRSRSNGQKRLRKKRNAAIPVAMPTVPSLPPAAVRPPVVPPVLPSSERVSPPDHERATSAMESSSYPLLISESDDDDSSSNNNTNQNGNAPPPPYMPPPHPSRHPHHPPPPSRRPQQRYRPLRTTSAIGLTTSGPPGVAIPGGNNGPPANRPPSGTRRGTRGSRGPRASSVGRANSAPYYPKFDESGAFSRDDTSPKTDKELEKQRKKFDKELKQRQKDAERRKMKDEKRRVKEAEKQEKQEAKDRKREAKTKMKANSVQSHATLDDFRTSPENPLPEFLEKAIQFIEKEGLDAEGLYRVPGNRAHVDLLFQQFDEDHNIDIVALDIAVNAVATAVKDFFFKRLPPILDPEHMSELESISLMQDRSIKILELGKLLKRLPKTNFAVLKFIFQHFVRVTELSKDNCMDSKNLAICWWPTLLQYEFGDLNKFESMRPHLEDIVQTMIDQFRFLFCGQEEVMMV